MGVESSSSAGRVRRSDVARGARDSFVLLAYELGTTRATGVLTVEPPSGPPELVLVRSGATLTSELDALGRQAGARLARLDAMKGARFAFHTGGVDGGERLFPLARWARQHIERQLDLTASELLVREIGARPLALREGNVPELMHLESAERRMVAALARGRTLSELAAIARVPRYRALSFVHFLRAVGALSLAPSMVSAEPPVRPALASGVRAVDPARRPGPAPTRSAPVRRSRVVAFQVLGLPVDADATRVRKAFRSLAHAWHPDRHPGVGEVRRRQLEQRLATLNAAYAELMAG
ncbi:MAG: J domain-containing protein [Polyangiaceae bacterium]|nr:J domain-containing protein [Polyangiaceae bacterium]